MQKDNEMLASIGNFQDGSCKRKGFSLVLHGGSLIRKRIMEAQLDVAKPDWSSVCFVVECLQTQEASFLSRDTNTPPYPLQLHQNLVENGNIRQIWNSSDRW